MTHPAPTVTALDRIKVRYANLPNLEIWVNEALFGFRHVAPYLDSLTSGEHVLEVGSGSGLLASLLNEAYPEVHLEGVEPYGDGFSGLSVYHDELARDGVKIHKCGYENIPTTCKYRFIFLVNVFEHLENWRDFVDFIESRLTDDGQCLVLCPNYGFPYESHVGIPVIFNKSVTYRLFSRKIRNYEQASGSEGLWKSLNFVRYSQVRWYCRNGGLIMTPDPQIIVDMIDRLDSDLEFSNRQRLIAGIARAIRRLGVLKLLKFEFVQRYSPYMKLVFSRR